MTDSATKRVAVLGASGSIGTQALEIITASDRLDVAGLAVGRDWETAVAQARGTGAGFVAIADPGAADLARASFDGVVLSGKEAAVELIGACRPDFVLNGVVGAAGLGPTVAALSAGLDVGLANKESLVIGGELVMDLTRASGARLLPVDSEHSAIFQLLSGEAPAAVARIVLTASGGPFRGRTDLAGITVEEALDHPTWSMGGRITVDSATLMNKGFEMIEAHHLFGLGWEQIETVVHPQSIVHSLVDLVDGATLAHLGYPDMRVPIGYALNWPDRLELPVERLDLARIGELTFEAPDPGTFRCLALAREAGQNGGIVPCILNAADEIAVDAFLEGRIGFGSIPEVIEQTIEDIGSGPVRDFDELFAVDEAARERSLELISGLDAR
ncbi:MAG: 1-deoxy-D-xylulose-5-phosphate reductoisomerase [Solirubrobacterales bacterium]|nr:1-deoxy-D-xylulose-5-phosphate reductoisomerase [Solirubrobacterales bacterium]